MRNNLLCYIKGLYHTLPIMTHVRECQVIKYPERLHFKIPLHETINKNKPPVIAVVDGCIEIIFTN